MLESLLAIAADPTAVTAVLILGAAAVGFFRPALGLLIIRNIPVLSQIPRVIRAVRGKGKEGEPESLESAVEALENQLKDAKEGASDAQKGTQKARTRLKATVVETTEQKASKVDKLPRKKGRGDIPSGGF